MWVRVPVGLLAFTLFFGVVAGWAQEKKESAQAAVSVPPQIGASIQFLKAWGQGKWDDLVQVMGGKITVSLGGKEYVLDPGGKKAEVQLVLPFRGLSTVREGGKVKAVTVDEMTVKAGSEEKKGKATLTLEEKDRGIQSHQGDGRVVLSK